MSKLRVYSILLFALGCSLIGGSFLEVNFDSHLWTDNEEHFRNIVASFGVTFAAASILSATIDRLSKTKDKTDISRSAITSIYGISQVEGIFSQVEENVFKQPFLRENLEVRYEFIEAREDRILLKYDLKYELKNISRKPEDFQFSGFVESQDAIPEAWQHPLGLQQAVVTRIDQPNQEKIDLIAKNDALSRSHHDSAEHYFINDLIPLKNDERILVEASHYIEKYARDSELWRSILPASDLSVSIHWPSMSDLKCNMALLHFDDAFDHIKRSPAGIDAFHLKPFMRSQGVLFWWERTPEE